MADINDTEVSPPTNEDQAAPDPDLKPRRPDHEPQDDVPFNAAGRSQPERLARALEHARICARIADDNRAKDILLLDLRQATPLVDFFVIATANSRRQGNAIAERDRPGDEAAGRAQARHRRLGRGALDPDRLRRLRRPRLLERGADLLRPGRHLGRRPPARLARPRPRPPRAADQGQAGSRGGRDPEARASRA